MASEITGEPDLDRLLECAATHGVMTDEPDHETGDLIDLLTEAWRIMSPKQRKALLDSQAGLSVLEWE